MYTLYIRTYLNQSSDRSVYSISSLDVLGINPLIGHYLDVIYVFRC